MAYTTPTTRSSGDLITASIWNTDLVENIKALREASWPVGAIFTSVVSTNPATLLGFGTWSAFGAGRVLVGIDAGQTEFDTVKETGGSKTHTLTTTEMPSHTHTYNATSTGSPKANSDGTGYDLVTGISSTNTGSQGGGGAHNNLQPYIVVYFWERTA